MAIYYPTEGPYIVYITISFLFEKFFRIYLLFYVYVCTWVYACELHECSAHRGQRGLGSLNLDAHGCESPNMGAGNQRILNNNTLIMFPVVFVFFSIALY